MFCEWWSSGFWLQRSSFLQPNLTAIITLHFRSGIPPIRRMAQLAPLTPIGVMHSKSTSRSNGNGWVLVWHRCYRGNVTIKPVYLLRHTVRIAWWSLVVSIYTQWFIYIYLLTCTYLLTYLHVYVCHEATACTRAHTGTRIAHASNHPLIASIIAFLAQTLQILTKFTT